MPVLSATAPGKVILFGEHAVVYGRPAIAVPVNEVRARVIVIPDPSSKPGHVHISAPAVGLDSPLAELPDDHPLAEAINLLKSTIGTAHIPACSIRINSSIPVASGLGSGAAVSVALLRALSAFLGSPLTDEQVNEMTFEVEKLYHGTPSGIDNTVVTYNQPVFYIRGQPIEGLNISEHFMMIIADSGVAYPTARSVADVRAGWMENPQLYEELFDQIGQITQDARNAIESGETQDLGALMDANQELLHRLDVSSPEIDYLIEVSKLAGASGAKLSGGGRGGYILVLVEPDTADLVSRALVDGGARRTILTVVGGERFLPDL